MTDLSVVIPARNEQFLARTVQDILANMRGDTEVIAVLDGNWADPPIPVHERVTVLHFPESIGQRAATNRGVAVSKAKWIIKADAHCAFDEGFDVKMLEAIGGHEDWTMAPTMRNLHVFDWVCPNGHRRYQSPSGPCKTCGEPTTMEVVWIPKTNPASRSYCFDPEPHFQYFREFNKRPEGKGDLTPSMSLQGSFFMLSRERYWELNVCDEAFGSWGSQGIEVACKSWLSGGQVMINQGTWYAHCFRTQGGDFGFPYHLSGKQIEHAKDTARELFFGVKWEKAVHPLSWLVEKFWPVPGWKDEDLAALKAKESKIEAVPVKISQGLPDRRAQLKARRASVKSHNLPTAGIVYYTDNQLDETIQRACQKQLLHAANGLPIVAVSLKPLDGFESNIVLPMERGYLAMFKQILAGLEALDTDVAFMAEHDILYSPSHFTFRPPRTDAYFYNTNTWKVRASDGHALYYLCKQTLALCACRAFLVEHYRKRVANTEAKLLELGDSPEYRHWIRNQGFEPGSHGRAERVDDYKAEGWVSQWPNIDIRHDCNLTPSRWSQDKFRDKRNCRDWQESVEVPGWGRTEGRFVDFLNTLMLG